MDGFDVDERSVLDKEPKPYLQAICGKQSSRDSKLRESNPDQRRHIPGEFNPADLATRGVSATELCQSKCWMCGPQFLTNDEETWAERLPNKPSRSPDAVVRQEEKKVETHTTNETEDVDQTNRLDPRRYSSWTRLVRVTAWIKRFVKNCKAPPEF